MTDRFDLLNGKSDRSEGPALAGLLLFGARNNALRRHRGQRDPPDLTKALKTIQRKGFECRWFHAVNNQFSHKLAERRRKRHATMGGNHE